MTQESTPTLEPCPCYRCTKERTDIEPGPMMMGQPVEMMRMFLCQTCGNKRCPHAADHNLACTGSNEPGQLGSLYENAPTPPASQSDEALVEELARTMWNTPNAIDANHPEMTLGSGVVFARAILPIIAAREAVARAEGRREGIEAAADKASAFDDEAKDNPYSEAARVIAAAIRALAEKQP